MVELEIASLALLKLHKKSFENSKWNCEQFAAFDLIRNTNFQDLKQNYN